MSKFREVMIIAKSETGEARMIDLTGLAVELTIINTPKADGGTADLKRRLAEAREGLEFYADAKNYAQRGRNRSKVQEDKGDVARDTLEAIRDSNDEQNMGKLKIEAKKPCWITRFGGLSLRQKRLARLGLFSITHHQF